jgi:thiamine biosynthesis lipoprotein
MTMGMGAQAMRLAMGTVMTHKAFGGHAEECLNAVCEEVVHLERILSRFLPESDISRINRSAGIQCENVSLDTYEVLSQAVEFSRKCQGCFDVTIGPLVTLWNGNKEASTPPDESSIRQVLPLVNDRDLPATGAWRYTRNTASLRPIQISAEMWSLWGQNRMAVPGRSASSIPGKKTA